MNLLRQALREILFRRYSAALAALAIAIAVGAACFIILSARAAENETRIIQRDIGLNVIILSDSTSVERYWTLGYADHSMPEEYIDRVATQDVANRLVPLLVRRVPVQGVDVMLTGIAGERFIDGSKKAVFGFDMEPGTAVVGAEIAAVLGLERGVEFVILGEKLSVERVLAPQGTDEDVRVYTALADAQRLLDLPGRINEIQALECHCDEGVADPLARLRSQLEPLLPGTRIIRRSSAADTRLRQRHMAERNVRIVTPIIVVLAGLWTATLMLLNVRERRNEIGVLRSLGFDSPRIAALWTLRALLLGLVGAAVGWAIGNGLFVAFGARLFYLTEAEPTLDTELLLWVLLAGPAFAAAASFVPIAAAASTDPASLLETT